METIVLGLPVIIWITILGSLAALVVSGVVLGWVLEQAIRSIRAIWSEEPPPSAKDRRR